MEKFHSFDPMFKSSESLAVQHLAALQTPNSPRKIDHTHEFQHLKLEFRVKSRIVLSQRVDLLGRKVFFALKPRELRRTIVKARLIDKIGDVIGKVVVSSVVIVNQKDFSSFDQHIEVIQVIVTNADSLI